MAILTQINVGVGFSMLHWDASGLDVSPEALRGSFPGGSPRLRAARSGPLFDRVIASLTPAARRFPAPWSAEELPALLTKEKARRATVYSAAIRKN